MKACSSGPGQLPKQTTDGRSLQEGQEQEPGPRGVKEQGLLWGQQEVTWCSEGQVQGSVSRGWQGQALPGRSMRAKHRGQHAPCRSDLAWRCPADRWSRMGRVWAV